MFKFTRTNVTKFALTAALALTVASLTGCGKSSSTASLDLQSNTIFADSSLGAGDSLGGQVFSQHSGTTSVAVLHTAEDAFALAEAQEANGTYDAWYASFDRPTDDIGTAVASGNEQSTPDAVAGVEVPGNQE